MIDRYLSLFISPARRALTALLLGALMLVGTISLVAAQPIEPGSMLVTAEEAGRQATQMKDETGADDRAQWAHRRWERNRDNEDVKTGPVVIDHVVFVARDVSSARAIYTEQSAMNEKFPEAADKRVGSFPFKASGLGDDVNALSACDDCSAEVDYELHHRLVIRKGAIVNVLYVYGRQSIVTQELAVWFANQVLVRVPENVSAETQSVSTIAGAALAATSE